MKNAFEVILTTYIGVSRLNFNVLDFTWIPYIQTNISLRYLDVSTSIVIFMNYLGFYGNPLLLLTKYSTQN